MVASTITDAWRSDGYCRRCGKYKTKPVVYSGRTVHLIRPHSCGLFYLTKKQPGGCLVLLLFPIARLVFGCAGEKSFYRGHEFGPLAACNVEHGIGLVDAALARHLNEQT